MNLRDSLSYQRMRQPTSVAKRSKEALGARGRALPRGSLLTRRWSKTDSNPRSLSGEEGDRTTPSLASNDFHGSKYPNGQSKTAEAAVVKAAIRQRVGEG